MTIITSMNLPPMPPGIDRDETQHGKLYFTRKQMVEYARRCIDADRADRIQSNSATFDANEDGGLDFFRDIMGMNK